MATISVIIKALNEERHIAQAIESALAAVAAYGGEVILADSGSTDRTVEIARHYPIRVVQLADRNERCCGVGPQLGYQHSRGEFLYLMDGDMILRPEFVRKAMALMQSHPEIAGIGGVIEERALDSLEYQLRALREALPAALESTDRLNGGGLYRRAAIVEAGYLSDRNLRSYEEFDLAARLRAKGWRLVRLAEVAVVHHGHSVNAYRLLWRRVRTGYAFGIGDVLKAALGRPHLRLVLAGLKEIYLWLAMIGWWLTLAVLAALALPLLLKLALLAAVLAAPVLVMAVRARSFRRGLYAVTAWNAYTAGLVAGLLRPRRPPAAPIASLVLRDVTPPGIRAA